MTAGLFLLLVLGGGVGAALRYVADGAIKARTHDSWFPWSTAIINLTGSLALGFLTGLVVSRIADTDVSAVVGTGLLGGYTTFSTASYETVQMAREGRMAHAFVYGFGVLVAGVGLALAGYLSGSRV
ncbi:fluoride efflux transporter CrcB [Nocardioides sp. cx-169]|uniref:fluoride efflux transporter CrcB n=1 Tax=Nocardioides sp. cx-169 TaxID=2899080 RepID=UPI001E5C2EDD|nr:fluoride efflux transporter CrcB [Nocardioides sp. cx-169]MCD4533633.1 fluoride efflux transporter CrcB [Nocardioides sp. cx-169]